MSQAGQDYWVYGEAFNQKKNGYFLDIGAHDGITFSNTYKLESKYGWSGICIEANPNTFKELKSNRTVLCLNTCLDKSAGEVDFVLRGAMGKILNEPINNKNWPPNSFKVVKLKTTTLNSILYDYNVPKIIDYLSIDVEGSEERILSKFDFNDRFVRCITIERPTEYLRSLLKKHNYILIKEIPNLDCFYIHADFLNEYMKNMFKFYNKKYFSIRWR